VCRAASTSKNHARPPSSLRKPPMSPPTSSSLTTATPLRPTRRYRTPQAPRLLLRPNSNRPTRMFRFVIAPHSFTSFLLLIHLSTQWCSVVKTNLGGFRTIVGGEVDCVRAGANKDRISTKDFIELKTNIAIRSERDEENFERCAFSPPFRPFPPSS
jgi:hypothetical protein